MEVQVIFGVNAKVVHVDLQSFFPEHVGKDMVHECLECGGCITESEEHDGGFEESHGSDESSFPLVFLNTDIVVSPANVKLGEQSQFLHIIHEFQNEREWIGILDSMRVQVSVVLARAKGSVLLQYEEERRSLGGF